MNDAQYATAAGDKHHDNLHIPVLALALASSQSHEPRAMTRSVSKQHAPRVPNSRQQ